MKITYDTGYEEIDGCSIISSTIARYMGKYYILGLKMFAEKYCFRNNISREYFRSELELICNVNNIKYSFSARHYFDTAKDADTVFRKLCEKYGVQIASKFDKKQSCDDKLSVNTLTDNGDGTYNYTDENGEIITVGTLTIDKSIKSSISLKVNKDNTYEYINENGTKIHIVSKPLSSKIKNIPIKVIRDAAISYIKLLKPFETKYYYENCDLNGFCWISTKEGDQIWADISVGIYSSFFLFHNLIVKTETNDVFRETSAESGRARCSTTRFSQRRKPTTNSKRLVGNTTKCFSSKPRIG